MKVEISNGELVDKVCILIIKLHKIKDFDKRINIIKEFDVLIKAMDKISGLNNISKEIKILQKVDKDL